jgi:hypothetical protein
VALTIERNTLIQIAKDAALQRMAARPTLISAYLTGSVAANEALLGGATDIDLILIDLAEPLNREVVRLTDQVALDVEYRPQRDYEHPKNLRTHPWRGPELAEPLFVHDPRHFFELAQSSARGQFHRPDHVAARARAFVRMARGELHIGLLPGSEPAEPVTLENFCRALLYSANAAISLTGFPGAGRRLLIKLEAAAQKLTRADAYDDFLAVFGGPALDSAQAQLLLADWSAAFRAGQSEMDELIHPARRTIYERGFTAQIEADRAAEMLWLMLYTWQAAMRSIPADSPHTAAWATFLERLRLADPEEYRDRVLAVRGYVETVDALVEGWAESNGA